MARVSYSVTPLLRSLVHRPQGVILVGQILKWMNLAKMHHTYVLTVLVFAEQSNLVSFVFVICHAESDGARFERRSPCALCRGPPSRPAPSSPITSRASVTTLVARSRPGNTPGDAADGEGGAGEGRGGEGRGGAAGGDTRLGRARQINSSGRTGHWSVWRQGLQSRPSHVWKIHLILYIHRGVAAQTAGAG